MLCDGCRCGGEDTPEVLCAKFQYEMKVRKNRRAPLTAMFPKTMAPSRPFYLSLGEIWSAPAARDTGPHRGHRWQPGVNPREAETKRPRLCQEVPVVSGAPSLQLLFWLRLFFFWRRGPEHWASLIRPQRSKVPSEHSAHQRRHIARSHRVSFFR